MVLIEQIYDAAFDRTRFPALLEALAAALGGQSAFLGWSDIERNCGFEVQIGNDPKWLQSYVETYFQHDILRPILYDFAEGQPAAVAPYLARKEVRDSLFYREYLAPQRIVDNVAVNLIKRPGMIATLAVLRMGDVAPYEPEHLATMRALVPHLTRAVLIQSRLIDGANTADGFRQSTAGTRDHILLLGEGARIVEIHPQLAAIVGLGVGQVADSGAFGAAVRAALAGDGPAVAEIHGEDGGVTRLLCEAQALTRDRLGDLVANVAATHAIHVALIDRPRSIAYGAIARLHRLTPTEARVMEAAVEQGDLVGIGTRLGMARATARTHLHRIYEKTGTSGFADLCRLAYRFTQVRGVPEQARSGLN